MDLDVRFPIGLMFSLFGTILAVFGLVSDRVGRRRAIVIALLCALTVIPVWAFAPSLAVLVVGAFLMQFFVQGSWGVIPAHITELSPDSVRGFLPGVAYQIGIAAASSIAYLEAAAAAGRTYAVAMAITAGIVFSAAALLAAVGPERRGIVYGAEARH